MTTNTTQTEIEGIPLITLNDDLIENSFVKSSSFLKKILSYSPVSTTIEKSQDLYSRAKNSNRILTSTCDKVENSVQNVLNSRIAKFLDSTLVKIDNKIALDEKSCKVLDYVEHKTELVVESIDNMYAHGRGVVEDKTDNLVSFYHNQKDTLTEKTNHFIEQGIDIISEKKEKLNDVYSTGYQIVKGTKNSIIEKKNDVIDTRMKQFHDMYLVSKEKYFDKYFGEYVRITRERLAENYIVQKVDVYYHSGKDLINEKYAYGADIVLSKKNGALNFGKDCIEKCEKLKDDYLEKANEFYDTFKKEREILRSNSEFYKNKLVDDANKRLEQGKEEVKFLLRKGKEETSHLLEKGETIFEQTKENLNKNVKVQKGKSYFQSTLGYYSDIKNSLLENYQVLYNIWTK